MVMHQPITFDCRDWKAGRWTPGCRDRIHYEIFSAWFHYFHQQLLSKNIVLSHLLWMTYLFQLTNFRLDHTLSKLHSLTHLFDHLVDVMYSDFEKAFDKVPHKRLISKLVSYGFNSTFIKWIQDFLKKQKV